MVACSPLLQYNLSRDCSSPSLLIRASSFGSGPLDIPVVRTLSVARVASPFSTDRTYQALFLLALKQHFQGAKRLVKQGDIIAVGIDTDALRRLRSNEATSDDALELDEPDTINLR